jgi:pyruvate ferredoxin oxidoreductase alpha subunit
MEMRRQSDEGMRRAKDVVVEAYKDFNRIFGRNYSPFLEEYMTEDAEVVLVGQGTLAMPAKVTVRKLREQGKKVGFVRLKWLRPFPTEEIQDSLKKFKVVGVIDRDYSYGSPHSGGVLYNEFRSALYDLTQRPLVQNFICGLGGREVTIDGITEMVDIMLKTAKVGKVDQHVSWIGVR